MQQVHTPPSDLDPRAVPIGNEDIDDIPLPPSEDEIPDYEGEPMESWIHLYQMVLLLDTLNYYLHGLGRQDVFVAGDMAIYWRTDQVGNYRMRAPDVLIAKGVEFRFRRNWVSWIEGKAPDVVIEILSDESKSRDLVEKKQIYQDVLRIPEYVTFDPATGAVQVFALRDGVYEPVDADPNGVYPVRQLDLTLVLWRGPYQGGTTTWLRWALPDGTLLPLREESDALRDREAEQLRARAAQAEQATAQAQQEAVQAQQETEQIRAEAESAKQEAARAQAERDALAAELARLRERLGEG